MKKTVQEIVEEKFVDFYEPSHQNGPDYMIPSENSCTWIPNGTYNLNLGEVASPAPTSVVSFFRNTVEKTPDRLALVAEKDGQQLEWTFTQYWNDVRTVAKGFIKLGLIPFRGVCILGFNSPEWVIAHLATIFAGGFAAGIYTTNSPEACFHVLNDCSANIVVVENEVQLKKILKIKERLANLKAIVQYCGSPQHEDVFSWDDLLRIGKSLEDDVLEKRIKGLAINQCCCLVYTSGTTGNPKGVMISHDGIISMIKLNEFEVNTDLDNKELSFMPLSHLAALAAEVYMAIYFSVTIYFCKSDALKGKLIDYLKEIEPNIFWSTPRFFEKIMEKLQDIESTMSMLKRTLYNWARKQALSYHLSKNNFSSEPFLFQLAKRLVLNKIKENIGLKRVDKSIIGGAPVSVDLLKFYLSLDLILVEGYGLSECSGVQIVNWGKYFRIGSVGNVKRKKQLEIKIAEPAEDGNGEILVRGRNNFMGYLNLERETKQMIVNGWIHTGDIGKIDEDGFLYITGRIKELVITSAGENIPPVLIEEAVKKLIPIVSNCMLVGDKRKYLTMLITLKTEIDLNTMEPLNELTPLAKKWCRSVGSKAETLQEILEAQDAAVMAAIQEGINIYNENEAISNAQRIQKWVILPRDFSLNHEELSPTAKLKRHLIVNKYANVINEMYG